MWSSPSESALVGDLGAGADVSDLLKDDDSSINMMELVSDLSMDGARIYYDSCYEARNNDKRFYEQMQPL